MADSVLENGADPHRPNDYGQTAVHRAMSAGPAVFQMLLSKYQDESVHKQCWFNLSDEYNVERFTKYLELLLAQGIDINTRRADGCTLYFGLRYFRGQVAHPPRLRSETRYY